MERGAAASDGHLAVSVDQLDDMPHQVGGHAGAKAGTLPDRTLTLLGPVLLASSCAV